MCQHQRALEYSSIPFFLTPKMSPKTHPRLTPDEPKLPLTHTGVSFARCQHSLSFSSLCALHPQRSEAPQFISDQIDFITCTWVSCVYLMSPSLLITHSVITSRNTVHIFLACSLSIPLQICNIFYTITLQNVISSKN